MLPLSRVAVGKVPDWLKRVGEATLTAACAAIAAWGVEEVKERVRQRREARKNAAVSPPVIHLMNLSPDADKPSQEAK